MKVVWSWLLELVDLDRHPTVEEGARALTAAGLEIEGLTDLGAGFTGVIVAEVVATRPHPEAAKLTLVDVITAPGGAATQVVCGAPNVPAPGRKVLWAPPGATLPGGITLATKPVKGIPSPGMLCSEPELGIGDDDDGIIVLAADDETPLGAPAQRALGVDDWLLEVNAPANRADCLGHLGIARELAALVGGRLVPPPIAIDDLTGDLDAAALAVIAIADPVGCPRYIARVIDGVTVGASPRKLAQRLRAVGVRPLSNIVDVTNYVMFELGQPMHGFDWHQVAGARIEVRRARAGERMQTLDGQDRALDAADLLICDGARPVAIAGVMGGLDSEVTAATTRVLLESASFDARSVRRTARRLGLHSEASHRFERQVDPALAELASARAASLLARLGGGRIARGAVDAYPRPVTVAPIAVRWDRLRALSGTAITDAAATAACTRLGFDVVATAARCADITPPSARADIAREVDVIEDVLRVIGYDQVPEALPRLATAPRHTVDDRGDRARRALAAAGLAEAITFGFQAPARAAALQLAADDRRARPIPLRNPMSVDQAVMRTSLLPNLIAAIARNRSFGRADCALFEVGSVFLRTDAGAGEIAALADEPLRACAVLAGHRPAWLGPARPWDFYDAKGLAEALIAALVGEVAVEVVRATDIAYLHPGAAARLHGPDGAIWGEVGEVHPATRAALGVEAAVFAFELDLGALPGAALAQMRAIPKFPAASRDLSLLVGVDRPAGEVARVLRAAADPLVEQIALREDYRDAKLPPGTKSMLFAITYRAADRTLTDVEVEAAHEAIVARATAELGATRR
jgi:phenylalanyl-tRNA synthetase beta chain